MNTLGISDTRDTVLKIKENIKRGYSLKDACNFERQTIRSYYSMIDYLNRCGFSYTKEELK